MTQEDMEDVFGPLWMMHMGIQAEDGKTMKELDELKESIASLDKALEKRIPRPAVEMVLVSDCLTGIVKVLEALVTPTEKV